MKAISFNVRGLGSMVKWRAIRNLISKEKPNLVCLQETKLEAIQDNLSSALWGDSCVEWRFVPAINHAGGLLCLWGEGKF